MVLNFETENANIIGSTGYLDREINFLSETVNAYFPPGFTALWKWQIAKLKYLPKKFA